MNSPNRLKSKEEHLEEMEKERYNNKKFANSVERAERVKKEREKRIKNKKDNMLVKLHHKEQILKEREKEKQLKIEILKEINTFKQKRKDIKNEEYRKEMELKREEFLEKLKIEQEKADAYAKQRQMILEQKATNQVIDQMKVHYYKEMYLKMKIKNQYGSNDFDKMTKNLKSIPDED